LPKTLSYEQLRQLARHGAQARLAELRAEIADIVRFIGGEEASAPSRRGGKRGKLSAAGRKAISAAQKARWANAKRGKKKFTRGKKRKGMSAAARKAVGERMKKYWTARRAQKAGAKK
jgi:hypothetical protein